MKKTFVAYLFITTVLFILTAPSFALEAALPEKPINIKEMTNSQIFRYGRELFRKGDYAEAAKTFKKILAIDCENTLAQYHLQKIAAKGPEFQDIADYLKNLPCTVHDFSEEDFLPASFYYEKDNDLLLEQLAIYNKRYRVTKATLSDQVRRYTDMAVLLEQKVSDLTSALNTAKDSDTQALAVLKTRFEESRDLSLKMDSEVAQLKEQLAQSRVTHQKELDALESNLGRNNVVSDEQTRQNIANKELELAAKSSELATLQEKFANIQQRLRLIERAIEDKNSQIKNIHQDVQEIQN